MHLEAFRRIATCLEDRISKEAKMNRRYISKVITVNEYMISMNISYVSQ